MDGERVERVVIKKEDIEGQALGTIASYVAYAS
jgi:hypothetical protein